MERDVQANFRLSEDVLGRMRKLVPPRKFSEFVESAIRKELKRLQFEKAIQTSFGTWRKRADLGSSEKFVRSLRKGKRLRSLS